MFEYKEFPTGEEYTSIAIQLTTEYPFKASHWIFNSKHLKIFLLKSLFKCYLGIY